jgi:TldD protein
MKLPAPVSFFRERFGVDEDSLARTLSAALDGPADAADLFFEYTTRDAVVLEEGIVKSGDRHLSQGVGVRVVVGERQGYAQSDEIDAHHLVEAAKAARAIAAGGAGSRSVAVQGPGAPSRDLYPIGSGPTEVAIPDKVRLLEQIDARARRCDPRVREVLASLVCQDRHVMVAASDGGFVADVQPLVRLGVQVIVESAEGRREVARQGGGGRFELGRVLAPGYWQPLVDEAVRLALLNLEARPCPAGVMDVVLGPGWPGVLLHEAVGHGLEGDFVRKGTSAFANRLGQRVAAPGVTVVDDGTLPGRRGSLNVDDEGTPTQRTPLIEDGILVGYLQDRLNARLLGVAPTGNGRRESYAHLPMPRMTNTFMLAGRDDPGEIVRSVSRGLYAVNFSEAYRIEDGRITAPVKGATLIGNGPDVLTRVSRIGHDLALDRGEGTCGKDGQAVPVGVGMPTIRIDGLTVGGTER